MIHPHGVTVWRIRAAVIVDPRNPDNTREDWTNATSLAIPGCAVAPRIVAEPSQPGRTSITDGFTVYAPPGFDVRATDRVVLDEGGPVRKIDGEPARWRNPFTGVDAGTEFNVEGVEG